MTIYKSPESELENAKLVNNYGGWLTLFLVLNYFFLSVFPISILAALLMPLVDPAEDILTIENLLIHIELLPNLVFSILILKIIKCPEKSVPIRVKSLMGWDLFATIVVYTLIWFSWKYGVVDDKPISNISSVFYYYAWRTYFDRSKRVKTYYVGNA